jgi:hypothetical protein
MKELILSWSDTEPGVCWVYTNWNYYLEAFQFPEEKSINWSTREELFFWGETLSAAQEDEWKKEKENLPETIYSVSLLHLVERETILLHEENNPYWIRIFTEHREWLERMRFNPYAYLLEEKLHPDGISATYLLPRTMFFLQGQPAA